MKPFRRTGFNVPLRCPLPKCRARGSWGTLPHACFSCFVLFASSKENEVVSAKPTAQLIVASEQFRKFLHYACLFDCLDNGRRNWNALRPRGPFLFRSAGKGSKRGRFARHCGSGKNSLTSHAVRFCGRCLGLPSAPSASGYEADQKLCFFVHFFFS